jgi:hypothetical protein
MFGSVSQIRILLGALGSGSVITVFVWIRILPSTSRKGRENLDYNSFVSKQHIVFED